MFEGSLRRPLGLFVLLGFLVSPCGADEAAPVANLQNAAKTTPVSKSTPPITKPVVTTPALPLVTPVVTAVVATAAAAAEPIKSTAVATMSLSAAAVGAAPASKVIEPVGAPAKSFRDRLDFAKGLYARDMYDMALEEYEAILHDTGAKEVAGEALVGAGESLFFLKRYPEARGKFKTYVERYPAAPEADKAHQRIGETLLYEGLQKEALAAFHELRSAKNESVRVAGRYYEGKISLDQGYLNVAAVHFKEVIDSPQSGPYTPYAQYYLGEVFLTQEVPEEAAKLFLEVAKSPDPAVRQLAWMGSGKALSQLHRPAESAAYFKQAYESSADPSLAEDALLNYMSELVGLEQFDELLKTAQREKDRIRDPKKQLEFKLLSAKGLSRSGQKEAAQGIFEEVMKTQGLRPEDSKAAKLGVTQNMIAQGQAEQALAFLDGSDAKLSLASDEIGFLRADALKALGRKTEALATYDAIAADGSSEFKDEAALARAYLYSESGEFADAAEAFRGYIRTYPEGELSAKAFSDLILVETRLENYVKAIEESQRFLDRMPTGAEAQKVHLRLAGLYTEAGQYDRAAETYDNHVRRFAGAVNPKEIQMLRAANAQRSGDTRGALKIYLKISRKDLPAERYAELLKNRAFGYVTLGRYRQAAEMYLKLFRDFSDYATDPEAYLWTADVYAHSGSLVKLEEVMGLFERRFGMAGHEVQLSFYRAEIDRLSGRPAEAILGYDRVLVDGGSLAGQAALGKGLAHKGQGNGPAAEQALEDALKLAGDDHRFSIQVRMQLGTMYQESKNYKEAAKTFYAVAILYDDPVTVPQALWGAGQAFEAAKDHEKAGQAYNELVERYPHHKLAREAAQRLKALIK